MDLEVSGAPGVTRTPDLLVRSQTLYPTELRAHSLNHLPATLFQGTCFRVALGRSLIVPNSCCLAASHEL